MGLKESNEITVRVKIGLEELEQLLTNKGFKIKEKFIMNDLFFIPNDLEIDKMTVREIIAKAVLIRDIYKQEESKKTKKITFKRKNIDENGVILSQDSINVDINNVTDAINLLNAIGFKQIMSIEENDIIYIKDNFEVAIKNITNGDILIEIETEDNEELDTIEKLKNKIKELNIPIDDDYFVKKAEIQLTKVLER